MITVNNRNLCENCFAEISTEPCPKCGYDKLTWRSDPITLKLGSVLNKRYMIGGVIGKGGFGITYLAYDLKLDARLAVKEYYPMGLALRTPGSTTVSVSNRESEESFKNGAEKFYNEAKMVARFNGNLNIVSVHDFFYENDTVYFTMGYLQGETLKSFLKRRRLTEGQAVRVMQDIANALMAVHSLNILHRDISPDNIMLCDDGTIKLLDFGAARQVMAEQSQSLSVILKQGFAPLEQYQKKGKQGPWTDIYALGATIYNALTGALPDDPMTRFDDDSELMGTNHGISDELWSILKKCVMLRIEDRYQDVFELKKDLNNISIEPEPLSDIRSEELTPPSGATAKAFDSTTSGSDPHATELLSDQQSKPTVTGGDETVLLQQDPARPVPEDVFPEPKSLQYDIPALQPQPGPQAQYEPYRNDIPQKAVKGGNKGLPVLIALGAAIVLLLGVVIGILVTRPGENRPDETVSALEEASTEEGSEEGSDEAEEEISEEASEAASEESDPSEEPETEEPEEEEAPAEEYEEEDDAYEAEEEDSYGEERYINIAYADATSELEAAAVDHATYYASNLYDGIYSTAWVDGVEGSAAGQSLVIHLKKKCNVTRLLIYNGYLKTKYRYTINGKVILAQIDYGDGHSRECPLNVMEPGMDDVPFDYGELNPTEIINDEPIYTDTIRLTILSDIPGTKYYDTAISEIEVYGTY
ncbi:MAG: serine/threonine protein kinase [Lachnospiraceae bacterium]|nr:serine/threonine protein kinase [Lachnospiraceae bacterium]